MSRHTKLLLFLITCIITGITTRAQHITFADSAELFMPGLVSTKNAEVKITFSRDGKQMLWGGIAWVPGKADFDIWQSTSIKGHWTQPQRVSFNSDSNDFDPYFLPDGSGVYFFSNRAGGFGGDDIYFVAYDTTNHSFGEPVNVGNQINTPGNEWAPVTNAEGSTLIFSSNGHGGFGGQDLFEAHILPNGYDKPINFGAGVNSTGDDFDAILLPNSNLVFTSAKDTNSKADLYISYQTVVTPKGRGKKINRIVPRVKLPEQINGTIYWTFGPSINYAQPGYLYFSGHLRNNMGRTDIYRIKYYIR